MSHSSLQTAFSRDPDITAAVADLRRQLTGADGMLCCFASPAYAPEALARELHRAFPGVVTIGCTSAGEIVGGHMLKGAIVAISLPESVVGRPAVQLVDLSDGAPLTDALARLGAPFGEPLADMDVGRYLGLVLVDGLSGAEEKLMESLGDATNVIFVGGAAGDDLKFERTVVFAEGRAASNAAVLVLCRPQAPFEVLKTQSFDILPKKLTVTAVDPTGRRVVSFDGKPAASAYAEALGVDVTTIQDEFMHHPLGLVIGGEPFVRSPRASEEGALHFYCRLEEGMELSLLQTRDIVADTGALLHAAEARGPIRALINFHCILRTLELESKAQTQAYADVFRDVPTVGFSTYGEEYIGHINQTSTMVLFR